MFWGAWDGVEERIADIAAWQATFVGYTTQDDRCGIGKRMEKHLKVGMTRAAVEQIMGTPQMEGAGDGSCYYYLDTAHLIYLEFDAQGKVSLVECR